MEARREARRRRILENADSRLKRVMDIQSIARKKPSDSATCENDDNDHLKPLPTCKGRDESDVDTTDEIKLEDDKYTFSTKTTLKEPTNRESHNSLAHEHVTSSPHTNDSEFEEGAGSQPDATMLKCIEQKQMVYRMLLIFGLAILLVVISNLKTVENTRYGEVRKSSFLLYFVTLELILLCLFPFKSEFKRAPMMQLVLKIFGLKESNIRVIHSALSLAARLFQDFAWFIFTVAILNYYFANF